ncbi:Os09g0458200, partial [Oryza sativa Japonica Group]
KSLGKSSERWRQEAGAARDCGDGEGLDVQRQRRGGLDAPRYATAAAWRPRCAMAAAAAASLFLLSAVNFVDGGGNDGLSLPPFCCEFCCWIC